MHLTNLWSKPSIRAIEIAPVGMRNVSCNSTVRGVRTLPAKLAEGRDFEILGEAG